TAASRGRFVARPTVSKLKLRASTVTASGVNPLLVIENSPRHFLPHSTIIGDTVCAEAARLKHTICSTTKHTTLFIFRFPLQKEKRQAHRNGHDLVAVLRNLRGLSADGD